MQAGSGVRILLPPSLPAWGHIDEPQCREQTQEQLPGRSYSRLSGIGWGLTRPFTPFHITRCRS